MKRKINKRITHKFFPLLWKECEVCGHEFRFESGWAFPVKYTKLGFMIAGKTMGGFDVYICHDCAKTHDLAEKIALELIEHRKNSRPPKPEPPLLPPKRTHNKF